MKFGQNISEKGVLCLFEYIRMSKNVRYGYNYKEIAGQNFVKKID